LKADDWICPHALEWSLPAPEAEKDKGVAGDIVFLQEGALQLNGEDKSERLRQMHDQIFVLRGAAFNGLIAFVLCLFAWGARWRSKVRWVMPFGLLMPAVIALYHHLGDRPMADPPFMEFTLLVLGISGGYLLWKRRSPEIPDMEKEPGRRKTRVRLLVLTFLITIAAFLAWWSTETLYYQQVVATYYAQAERLPK
jgi:hypothetical protein